ncbi:MAG: DUF2868 domain-containing protein [Betaproteobacteria bacterium]
MDEPSALNVVAVRAAEAASGARLPWSDADRAWASRAAAEVVGASATPDAFLARRAALALERLGDRHPALRRAVDSLRWRPWVGSVIVGTAFIVGIAGDRIGGSQHINILAPPVLVLLIWNIAVYVALVARFALHRDDRGPGGPLRQAVARIAGGAVRVRTNTSALGDTIADFALNWARVAGPLYAARAARILHLAAAVLAIGLLAGLYLRGLGLEYRAGWESTFLSAATVQSLLSVAYAPGAALTGVSVPDAAAIEAIRTPASENAARWMHLIAATILLIVIAPRLLLALFDGWLERRRARDLPIPLDEPYYQRLLRSYRGGPARVRVLPYSYTPSPAALAGLEAVIERGFGGGAAVHVAAPIAYGSDEALAAGDGARESALVALFNATATPEYSTHGAFLRAVRGAAAAGETVIALVDEHALIASRAGDSAGIEARRVAWREVATEEHVPVLFADLDLPELEAIERSLDALLAEPVK